MKVSLEYKFVFVVTRMDGRKKRCQTMRGAAKTMATDLLDRQYLKRRRCFCGRRDLFCEYSKAPGVAKSCAQGKALRVSRIGRYLFRKLQKAKKHHDKSKPPIEFVYSVNV